ncbi:histidine triad nucleotide-binding protein [Baia soyae]|uniref:Histidine triad (HIT) family protein n=1 Tax=Baia soyae TaxID=1544746 RepID=A0A4R2S257_9BACL|nr:histidine triad nucleotide-binding protein [Baia soyae]TCP69330.1 histidine triad (HIT) family protein [Baia soyae]
MPTSSECIFCKIVAGDIPCQKVYEDEHVIAFHDLYPVAPSHVLVIPKKHVSTLMDFSEADTEQMGSILRGAAQVAKKLGLDEDGFRVVNNMGEYGGQTVYHVHFHVLGGRQLTWPPG